MRANEFIAEAISSKVFHYTSIHNAYKIMTSRAFRLSAAGGSESERSLQKSKLYYLSTARSPSADYTASSVMYFGVVFNLNGDWFNQRYKGAPVDYWERSWWDAENNRRVYGGRTSEQEDRILSDQPYIKMGNQITQAIESIHILAVPEELEDDKRFGGTLRGLLLEAKKLGIPTYIYPDQKSFLVQDTSKVIPFADLKQALSFERPLPRTSYYSMRDDFEKYRELFYKTNKSQLSKAAYDELYKMFSYGDRGKVLDNDIHNAKSSDNQGLFKLMDIFRKVGVRTGSQYVDWVTTKWKGQMW